MRTKKMLSFGLFLAAGLMMTGIQSCKKDDNATPKDDDPPGLTTGTVTDVEGSSYATVKIGDQWWMAENLSVTKYRNGDDIGTTSTPLLDISGEDYPKYYWAFDGYEVNVADLGRLYTSYVIEENRGLCPVGWHIPTEAEWDILATTLGGAAVAGGKMKMSGIAHWIEPNAGATNQSGFSAKPGGHRNPQGNYLGGGYFSGWWAYPESCSNSTPSRYVYYVNTHLESDLTLKKYGLYVRCVKDN